MKLVDAVELSKHRCVYPLRAELKYATRENFVGRVIDGYTSGLTQAAPLTYHVAEQLCLVQNYLAENYGFGLLIFDAYRPKRAVKDFMAWSTQAPASSYEEARKQIHYPTIQKSQLFELGYVAENSNHCYGNTVDLVLIDVHTYIELDMGACFDFMNEISHITTGPELIGEQAYQNRNILSHAMQRFNFLPYEKEFWHFSHSNREVEQPIDLPITWDWVEEIRAVSR